MTNSDYPQLNVAEKYRTLPNFLAGAYSADFLKLAIALSDVWTVDGLGGGGGGGSTVSVDNFPSTFPATQSGTWTVATGLTQPLTDAQLRASAVPVSGTFFQATQPVSRAERTYTRFRVDTSTSGDNTIIAAQGAGVSIYVSELVVINKSTTATLVLLKEGSTTIGDVDMPSEGDGIVLIYGFDNEWKLPSNTALVGNLSGNNNISFWGRYRVG